MAGTDRSEAADPAPGRGADEGGLSLAHRTLLANAIDQGAFEGGYIITGWQAFNILNAITPAIQGILKEQREEIASAIEEEADELDFNRQPTDYWDAHQYFKQRLHDMAAIAYGDRQ